MTCVTGDALPHFVSSFESKTTAANDLWDGGRGRGVGIVCQAGRAGGLGSVRSVRGRARHPAAAAVTRAHTQHIQTGSGDAHTHTPSGQTRPGVREAP